MTFPVGMVWLAAVNDRPGDPSGQTKQQDFTRLDTDLTTQNGGTPVLVGHHDYNGQTIPHGISASSQAWNLTYSVRNLHHIMINTKTPFVSSTSKWPDWNKMVSGGFNSDLDAMMAGMPATHPVDGLPMYYWWLHDHEPETGAANQGSSAFLAAAKYRCRYVIAHRGSKNIFPVMCWTASLFRTGTPSLWVPNDFTPTEFGQVVALLDCYPKMQDAGAGANPRYTIDSITTRAKGHPYLANVGYKNLGFGEICVNNDVGGPSSVIRDFLTGPLTKHCKDNKLIVGAWFDNASGGASGTGDVFLDDTTKRAGFISMVKATGAASTPPPVIGTAPTIDAAHGVSTVVVGSGANIDIPVPSAAVAGDLLRAYITTKNLSGASISTVPTGWTLVNTVLDGSGASFKNATYEKIATTADLGTTPRWVMSTAALAVGFGVAIHGQDTSYADNPNAPADNGTSASLSLPVAGMTTAGDNELVIVSWSARGSGSAGGPTYSLPGGSPFTILAQATTAGASTQNVSGGIAIMTQATAGAIAGFNVTADKTQWSITVMRAVKPATVVTPLLGPIGYKADSRKLPVPCDGYKNVAGSPVRITGWRDVAGTPTATGHA